MFKVALLACAWLFGLLLCSPLAGGADQSNEASRFYAELLDNPVEAIRNAQQVLDADQEIASTSDEFRLRLAILAASRMTGDHSSATHQLHTLHAMVRSERSSAAEMLQLAAMELGDDGMAPASLAAFRQKIDELRGRATGPQAQAVLCQIAEIERQRYVADRLFDLALQAVGRLGQCPSGYAPLARQIDNLLTLAWVAAQLRDGPGNQLRLSQAARLIPTRQARFYRARWLKEAAASMALLGDPGGAKSHYLLARPLFDALKLPGDVAAIDLQLARLSLALKQWQGALEAADRALEGPQAHNAPSLEADWLAVQLSALVSTDSADIDRVLRRAIAVDRNTLPVDSSRELTQAIASAYAKLGDYEQAQLKTFELFEMNRPGLRAEAQSAQLAVNLRQLSVNEEVHQRTAFSAMNNSNFTGKQWLLLSASLIGGALIFPLTWVGLADFRRRRLVGRYKRYADNVKSLTQQAIRDFAELHLDESHRLPRDFSLAILTLDGHESLSASEGPDVASKAVAALGEAVKTCLRREDGMGPEGQSGWLIVAPAMKADEMVGIYGRIRMNFAGKSIPGMSSLHGLRISMGVVAHSQGTTTAKLTDLLDRARHQLSKVRAQGGHNVQVENHV